MADLLFFGPLRDIAGHSTRVVDLPETVTNVGELVNWLKQTDLELAALLIDTSTKIAVDQVIVAMSAPIRNASEIAFMPPMSGG
jgi:sulfur-carrier protein